MRLGWLSGIGAADSDACVGVVSALRSRLVRGGLRDLVLLALWGAGLGWVRGPGRGTVVPGCGTDDWGFGEGLCTLSADVQGCECIFRVIVSQGPAVGLLLYRFEYSLVRVYVCMCMCV